MAFLPKNLRFWLFDSLSVKTMRYVNTTPRHRACGIVAEAYEQIADDFFVNGSLTSRSQVPELFAGVWCGGRETVLVSDKVDRTTKEAMLAALSSINECPYCGDMLIALVHAGDQHEDAEHILAHEEERIADPLLRERLAWVKAMTTPGAKLPANVPFTNQQLPEVIGAIMAMSDINRFSHIVMDGSPVNAPMGISTIKAMALKIFGGELQENHIKPLLPGRALQLLPEAELPDDMQWARNNPRVADALSRWAAVTKQQATRVIDAEVDDCVRQALSNWQGEQMPISRNWVEDELGDLTGQQRSIARLALLLAKSSYQIDEPVVREVLDAGDQKRFIRILAWCTFTASRYLASRIAKHTDLSFDRQRHAA